MKIIRNILLIALALLLQSTWVGRGDIYGVRPDLAMLVFLIVISISDSVECVLYGFLIGFLQDVYSPEYLGFNAFTMSVVGFLIGFVRERITAENVSVWAIVTFFACVGHDLIYSMFYSHFDLSVIMVLFLKVSLPGAVFTSVLAIMFISVWKWAENGGLFIVIGKLMGFRG